MTPAELVALGQTLTQTVASRPVGGSEYVPLADYQRVLSAARALYSDATKPAPKAKP